MIYKFRNLKRQGEFDTSKLSEFLTKPAGLQIRGKTALLTLVSTHDASCWHVSRASFSAIASRTQAAKRSPATVCN